MSGTVSALADCYAPQASHIIIEVQQFRTLMGLVERMTKILERNPSMEVSSLKEFLKKHFKPEYGAIRKEKLAYDKSREVEILH